MKKTIRIGQTNKGIGIDSKNFNSVEEYEIHCKHWKKATKNAKNLQEAVTNYVKHS